MLFLFCKCAMEIIAVPNKQRQQQRAERINNCRKEDTRNQPAIQKEIVGLDNPHQWWVQASSKAVIGGHRHGPVRLSVTHTGLHRSYSLVTGAVGKHSIVCELFLPKTNKQKHTPPYT